MQNYSVKKCCKHCDEIEDAESLCNNCETVIICDECYNMFILYEDSNQQEMIYVCNECFEKLIKGGQ